MSILPNKINVQVGDSLSKIAYEVLGDSSGWRDIATINDIDIFKALEIGQNLTVPNKQTAERRLKNLGAESILNVNETVQTRVKEILDSREAKIISKLIGFDNKDREQLLKDLDLSSLSQGLSTPTKEERLRKALNIENNNTDTPAWNLISWIL